MANGHGSSGPTDMSFWREFLAGVEVKAFPSLKDGIERPSEWNSVAVQANDDPSILRRIGNQHNVSETAVAQTAWALVLKEYQGAEDVVFTCNIEDAGACAAQSLVSRIEVDAGYTSASILATTEAALRRCYVHAKPGLGDSVSRMVFGGSRPFNTALNMVYEADIREPATELGRNFEKESIPNYCLILNVVVHDCQSVCSLHYDTALISKGQATNVASCFMQALQFMAKDADQPIRAQSLASDQHIQNLRRWNPPVESVGTNDGCMQNRIAKQTRDRPCAPAISTSDLVMSYKELDCASDQLAQSIVSHGARPGDIVSVLMERSAWGIISLLAVCKAGCAFAVIDPSHPPLRRREIAIESRARLLLTSPACADLLKGVHEATIVVRASVQHSSDSTVCLPPVSVNDHAYVLFTSGSTGLPKGSVSTHGACSAGLKSFATAHSVSSESRTLQFASYAFVISLLEIFATLCEGGCVCIPTDYERQNDLPGFIREQSITTAILTPTMLRTLSPKSVPSLKHITVGAEVVAAKDVSTWAAHATVITGYGASELMAVTADDDMGRTHVPNIGKPSGARIFLTDPDSVHRLVPCGAVGEMIVQGPSVATEYINDAKASEHAFVPAPHWAHLFDIPSTASFFRSGDLARYHSDGKLEYIGRGDFQIKIRGQRVDLQEIEARLISQDPIQASAVFQPRSGPAQGRIVAALTFHEFFDAPAALDTFETVLPPYPAQLAQMLREVRAQLEGTVPPYMRPDVWIPMRSVPLTISRKVDRIKLRSWLGSLTNTQYSDLFPCNRLPRPALGSYEKQVSRATAAILALLEDSIDMDRSFLQHGGDSVLAINLAMELRETAGLDVVAQTILMAPSLAVLASTIASKPNSATAEPKQLSSTPRKTYNDQIMPNSQRRRLSRFELLACGVSNVDQIEIEDEFPCSGLQEALLMRRSERPDLYATFTVWRLSCASGSEVDIATLQQAWQQVVNRHPLLRTLFIQGGSGHELHHQVVLRHSPAQFEIIEGQHDAPGQLLQQLERSIANRQPFHNLTICKAHDGHVAIRLDIHHLLFDEISMQILRNDLIRLYDGNNAIGAAPPAFHQYINFIQDTSRDTDIDYWRLRLQDRKPCLFPKLTSQLQPKDSWREVVEEVDLSLAVIQDFCRSKNITIATLCQTAWALCLRLYANVDQVCFGLVLSGRDTPIKGIDDLVGPLINTVTCSLDIERSSKIGDLLLAVQTQNFEVLSHQYTSLAKVKHDLKIATPFNTVFSAQPQSTMPTTADLQVAPTYRQNPTEYVVSIIAEITASGIRMSLSHWTANMTADQAENIVHTLCHLVMQVITHGDEDVSSIDPLTDRDAAQILALNGKNPTAVQQRIPDVIARQVQLRPNTIAVQSNIGHLTYDGLHDLSTQLAHRLAGIGVGPNVVVAFCFEKSLWAVVAVLAISVAGGAPVAIDPSHPRERITKILSDTNCRVLLSSKTHASTFDAGKVHVDNVLVVDADSFEASPTAQDLTIPGATAQDLAFVVYTSGSSGTPKGIGLTHTGLCTSFEEIGMSTGVRPGTKVLQFASYVFDVSIADIFMTLTRGATICIPSDDERVNNLAAFIRAFDVNWACLTPTVAGLLKHEEIPSMKTLLLGGERTPKNTTQAWAPFVNLVQCYGPAETSVTMAVQTNVLHTDSPARFGQGKGALIWIVDAEDINKLLPIGAIGEILIEGPVLARGYLNDPVKTKQSFVHNPTWSYGKMGSDRRCYRSGDLGRYNEDGTVSFVARLGTQVKVHGQRIELGDIESNLQSGCQVQTAAVVSPNTGFCQGKLVAFLLLADPNGIVQRSERFQPIGGERRFALNEHIRELQHHLMEHVPPYMVPVIWIVVDAMPYNTNGKVDKKSLLYWIESASAEVVVNVACLKSQEEVAKPENEIETKLQNVWSQVLGMPKAEISIKKSFLSMGGDSLAAMQVVTRCRSLGLHVSVKDILRKNISALAANATVGKSGRTLQHTTSVNGDLGFKLAPAQRRFFELMPNGHSYFNVSILASIATPVPSDKLHGAFTAIMDRHEMLRARFKRTQTGSWCQYLTKDANASYRFEAHDATEDDIEEIQEASQTSLDLEHGPLVAVDLVTIPTGSQYLSFVAHHLVMDLTSWDTISSDLEKMIRGELLEPLSTTSYSTWIMHQDLYARTELEVHRSLPYDVPPADLEYWHMDGVNNVVGDTRSLEFQLHPDDTKSLMKGSDEHFKVVDAMIAAALFSFSETFQDRDPPAMWIEHHGRDSWTTDVDVLQTVGWFSTSTPVVVDSHGITVMDLAAQVSKTRENIPMNGAAYNIARYIGEQPPSESKYHAKPEVTLNYYGARRSMPDEQRILEVMSRKGCEVDDVGSDIVRPALFDILVENCEDRLYFKLVFNRRSKKRDLVAKWFKGYECSLVDLARSCTVGEEIESADVPDPFNTEPSHEANSELMPSAVQLAEYAFLATGHRDAALIEYICECTPTQTGMLLGQSHTATNYEYYSIWEVETRAGEKTDLARLQTSWQAVVDRHAVLRTTFVEGVVPNQTFSQVAIKDISARSTTLNLNNEDGVAVLSQIPPVKHSPWQVPIHVTFCQTPIGKIFLKIELNHAINDGESLRLILRNWSHLYQGLELSIAPPYREYVEYTLRQDKASGDLYWRQYLDGVVTCNFPRLVESTNPATELHCREVPCSVSMPSIQEFAAASGITLSNIVQLAWALTLKSFTDLEDVCFGYLTSGRDVPVEDIENIAGPCINILDDFFESLAHQHCSLANIQHQLSLGGEALFNTLVSVQKGSLVDHRQELAVNFKHLAANDPTEFGVSVSCFFTDEDLQMGVYHWTSTLSDGQALNVANLFGHCVEAIMHHLDAAICDLDLLGSSSLEQIRNSNAVPPVVQSGVIHQFIDQRTLHQPESPAVVSWDGAMTYAQLQKASRLLASDLIDIGIDQETIVPFCMEKSVWAVVAMLAILRVGGTCVALDPDYPDARKRIILEATNAKVVLAGRNEASLLRQLVPTVVIVDQEAETSRVTEGLTPKMLPDITPENASFVFFTSGSTGVPKGVVLTHQAMLSSFLGYVEAFTVSSTSRVLQFASYTFDVSAGDTFATLLVGGCVCLPSEKERTTDLSGAIRRMEVNWMNLTPSVSALLLPEDVPSVRTIGLGGELVSIEAIRPWLNSGLQVHIGYGLTETSVTSFIQSDLALDSLPSIIGHSYGCRGWVVDKSNHNRLVPPGCPGELLIEGPNLARGYLGDKAKTETAFMRNPTWSNQFFNNGQSARFYKTGDLVRSNPDGSIRYLHRKDTQVKVHGRRVEVHEIEHHLAKLSEIRYVAVLVPDSGACSGQLVAVVCLRLEDASIPVSNSTAVQVLPPSSRGAAGQMIRSSRNTLSLDLPAFMIPSAWIPIERMPTSAAGKTDRKLLYEFISSMNEDTMQDVTGLNEVVSSKPSNEIEALLQSVIGNVLHLAPSRVDLTNTFTGLGGDSLTAMNVVAACRRSNVNLTLREIFHSENILEIASRLHQRTANSEVDPDQATVVVPKRTIGIDEDEKDAVESNVCALLGLDISAIEDIYPSSPIQEGMLVAQIASEGLYDSQVTCEVRSRSSGGTVDVGRLEKAWNAVVARHSALRTIPVYCPTRSGVFKQVVLASHQAVVYKDAAGCQPDLGISKRPTSFADTDVAHRVFIQPKSDGSALVRIEINHTLVDGESLALLIGDWTSAYDGRLPEQDRLSCRDYIAYVQTRSVDTAINYWKAKLLNASPCYFPTLKAASEDKTNSGLGSFDSLNVSLDVTLEVVRSFCGRHNITPASLFQTAWALLLKSYTGQADVCFGSLCSEREVEVERMDEMIGTFINMLTCRLNLNEGMTISSALCKARDNFLDGLPHQHCSLAAVQHFLNLNGQPLFNTIMSIVRRGDQENAHDSSSIEFLDSGNVSPTEYDLAIDVAVWPYHITLRLDFWTEKVPREQAILVGSTFNEIVRTILEHPDTTVASLQPLSAASLNQIRLWNQQPPVCVKSCVHELIERQAICKPDAPAVEAWDAALTRDELNERASRLASHLQDRGVTRGTTISFSHDRSATSIVILLAILKAGAGFVFLDPNHPQQRLQSLLADCHPKLILVQPCYREKFLSLAPDVVGIDQDFIDDLCRVKVRNSDVAMPDDMAWIIYTSGSTGTPKGVMLDHQAVVTSACAHGHAMGVTESSRSLHFASYNYDVSLEEIFTTLILGGTVCVPSEHDRLNDLSGCITRLRVNWADLTPTVAKTIAPEQLRQFDPLCLGGEPVRQDVVDFCGASCRLVNGYGPAEAAVTCIVNRKIVSAADCANIGFGVGCRTWIVDSSDHHYLAQIGSIGELLIEGPGLAKGYLNRKEESDAAFIIDPKWASKFLPTGTRLYKTGDLARYEMNGSLKFVGRKDTQVKLRGQRLELGEIEHHISTISAVEDVVVDLPKRGPFEGYIVAVVTLTELVSADLNTTTSRSLHLFDREVTRVSKLIDSVRTELGNYVPSHLVPSKWAVVKNLPHLASGKTDAVTTRRWIEDMSEEDHQTLDDQCEHAYATTADTANLTMTETLVRSVLASLLDVAERKVNMGRSFTSNGGDSITAMQFVRRCRAEGLVVTLQVVMRSNSLSAMCLEIRSSKVEQVVHEELPEVDFPLSPIQQYFFNLYPHGENHYNQSVTLSLRQPTSTSRLSQALSVLTAKHAMLRARFKKLNNGAWKQFVTKNSAEGFSLDCRHAMSVSNVQSDLATAHCALNVERGPVFTAHLFHLSSGHHVLGLIAHHLIVDLVSWRVLIEDLDGLLTRPEYRIEPSLPFSHWCKLQADRVRSLDDTALEQVPSSCSTATQPAWPSFWGLKTQDRANTFSNTLHRSFVLREEDTTLLLSGCHEALRSDATDVMLAAVLASFADVFNDRALPTIHVESHGRDQGNDDADLYRTVGWFTTISPISLEDTDALSLVGYVAQIKDQRRRIATEGAAEFAEVHLSQRHIANRLAEIHFNYTGLFKGTDTQPSFFQHLPTVTESHKQPLEIGASVLRDTLFDILVVPEADTLRFGFTFCKDMRNQDRIEKWISSAEIKIKQMILHLSTSNRHLTASDFPLAKLSPSDMRNLSTIVLPIIKLGLDEVEDVYPCSPVQQGILISQIRSPALYDFFDVWELYGNGPLDVAQLQKAWQQTVKHHSILRTKFINGLGEDGLYSQVVHKSKDGDLPVITSPSQFEMKIVEGKRASPFDSHGHIPRPWEATIFVFGDRTFLKLSMTHALVDGYSMAIIARDFARAFEGTLHNPVPSAYRDYIKLSLNRNSKDDSKFWAVYLDQAEPCMLRTDGDFGDLKSSHISQIDVTISMPNSWNNTFVKQTGHTLATLFQLSWAIVLRYFAASNDVCFGYLTAGREAPIAGIEDVAGVLVNMLVSRVRFDPDATTDALLEYVKSDYLQSLQHQYIPLYEIQRLCTGAAEVRLFNTVLSMRGVNQQPEDESSSLEVRSIIGDDPTEFDIVVYVNLTSPPTVSLSYQTSRISPSLAANIASLLGSTVKTLVQSPTTRIKSLSFVGSDNHAKMLAWNSATSRVEESCVHRKFEDQVDQSGDAPALCSWDGDLTYTELDQRAESLASKLTLRGIGRGSFVPLHFNKSIWAVVAMVAVLKTGAAYTCLDPTHPWERKFGIVAQLSAKIVLSGAEHRGTFYNSESLAEIVVAPATVGSCIPKSRLNIVCSPNDSAFVIYTSGSTGKPKGSVMSHAAFCSGARNHCNFLGITSSTRTFQFAGYTFDISFGDIFYTLIRGGCVCIPSEIARLNNLCESVRETRANWSFLTPTVANTLCADDVPSLKILVLGGETPTAQLYQEWANRLTLINTWGPSEACMYSTGTVVQPFSRPDNIGRGLGSKIWIVDAEDDVLTPIGAVGELVVEAPFVASGYLDEQEKTAAAFISNPIWRPKSPASYSERIYRTGDLGRSNPDGSITFVGRRDAQIKLRGQRIELGEIQHHLQRYLNGAVQVVVEVANRADSQPLAAFFTTSQDTSERLCCNGIRFLPTYMIPSVFVPVQSMPLSAGGKLLRRDLRQTASELPPKELVYYSLSEHKTEIISPSTEREFKLRDLWATVLRMKSTSISALDSFFHLGADSIAAMRLVTLARRNNIALSVADIFNRPVLNDQADIAVQVELLHDCDVPPFALLPQTISREGLLTMLESKYLILESSVVDVYPCSPLQEGLIALSAKQPGTYVSRQVFDLPEAVDIERFKYAWETTVRSNPILRTVIVSDDSTGSLQVVLSNGVEWSTQSTLTTEEVTTAYGGPLAHFALLCKDGIYQFHLTLHHAVYDGISLQLILDQTRAYYETSGHLATSLKPVQYSQFIKYLTQSDRQDVHAYWSDQLRDPDTAHFPAPTSAEEDFPKREVFHQDIALLPSSGFSYTVPIVLRTAWAVTLSLWTASRSVLFGATLSGRSADIPGVEHIVGPLITTVPVRITIDPSETIEDLLNQVHAQAAGMIPYEHTGLQEIARISPQTRAAGNLQNLLVVTPKHLAGSQDKVASAFFRGRIHEEQTEAFHTLPLVVECIVDGNSVHVITEYDSSRLSSWQVKQQVGHFAQLLGAMMTDRTCRLSALELVPPRDYDMISRWNSNPAETVNDCIHEAVWQQVIARPSATAICSTHISFTYLELDQKSTLAARLLRNLGVGAGHMVPLCFEKSASAIIAMLAVLKVGAAYVPLDASAPIDRKTALVDRVGSKVILASKAQTHSLAERLQQAVCYIEDNGTCSQVGDIHDSGTHASEETLWLTPKAQPSDAAVIIFTSGSTGAPKPVVLEHRNLCTSMKAHGDLFEIGALSRVLQFASYTFDASILDIFTTLTRGGCVCVPSEHERVNELASAIVRMDANWACITTTVAMTLHPAEVPSIQGLCIAGEKLTHEAIARWADAVELTNGYGPTESSILTSVARVRDLSCNSANIGHALANVFWVVNPGNHRQLQPVGCPGELLLEGPLLAREYLGDKERTQESFEAMPCWLGQTSSSRRTYATGDLVHYNEDGSLNILGRKDYQVKIHGQRVELGEIEFHLHNILPAVWSAAVETVVRNHRTADFIIAAFLTTNDAGNRPDSNLTDEQATTVSKDETQLSITAVRKYMESKLPRYMLPAAYLHLRRMPVTESRKIDRRALRRHGESLSQQQWQALSTEEPAFQSLETLSEIKLGDLWARILNIPAAHIGKGDHFLHAGGDSVSAMRLASAAKAAGIALSVTQIFRNPRLMDMALIATACEESNGAATYSPFATLGKVNPRDFVKNSIIPLLSSPCEVSDIYDIVTSTDYQAFATFHTQLGMQGYMQYFTLALEGYVSLHRLREACASLVQSTDALRMAFVAHRRQTYSVIFRTFEAEFNIYQDCDSQSQARTIALDRSRGTDLAEPITRFLLLQGSGDKCSLIIRLSHAQYDGLSLPLLWQRLVSLYEGTTSPPRSPSHSQYVFTARAQQKSKDSKAFWKTYLQGAQNTTLVARLSPGHLDPMAASVKRYVTPPPGGSTDVTTFAILKAAWAIVLSRACGGQRDVVFGQASGGRNIDLPGADEVIGACLTFRPVRVAIDPSWSCETFLKMVQEDHIATVPHETLGWQTIIAECTQWPKWARWSSFISHINLGGSEEGETLSLGDAKCTITSDVPDFDRADVFIWSVPEGGRLGLEMVYSPDVIEGWQATWLLEKLQETFARLAYGVEKVSAILDDPGMEPGFVAPLPYRGRGKPESAVLTPAITQAENFSPDVHDLVNNAWRHVLRVPVSFEEGKESYNVWGHQIAAAQLASMYRKAGYPTVNTELTMMHATKRMQKALLQSLRNS
ncbi:acetyl-CoA synthetase-like protein [Polychaeton citri CBS 116435]|uniref:Acetyl-CoA synthetase-like protein n=1 Tax=Polychaeton citri CBS 116435 TaxID=1314669 RepID=A0A9P4UKL9_9PEZI|nr:acetyl-CoA synthetase-like protein [Polychaeton citri CBS 116435]